MLRRRLITGPILILVLVGLGWLDGMVAAASGRAGVVLAILAIGVLIPVSAWEAATMVRAAGHRISVPVAVVSAELLCLCLLVAPRIGESADAAGIVALGVFLVAIAAFVVVLRGGRIEGGFGSIAATILVAIWTGLFIGFWVLTAEGGGAAFAAGLILIVKAGDIGAYTVGMLVGRRKLIPWLSPGKTIEGAGGAVAGSMLAGVVLAGLVGAIPWWAGLLLGGVLGVIGALGDLFESLLKREAGWKDSGRTLPGMGGLLDVLDSLLLAGPVVWMFMWMID